jgi:hypothetical protein
MTWIVWSGHSCPFAFDFDLVFDSDREEDGFKPGQKTMPKNEPGLSRRDKPALLNGFS